MSRRSALAALGALATTGCSKLVFFAANVPAAFGSYTRHANIPYGAEPQHRLDVYVPDKVSAVPRPIVVFWHGGRWTSGDKDDYKFVAGTLTELGYVVVVPNYRHYPQVKMAGFMDDTARSALWAVDHAGDYGADPNRLFMMGHSSGAHMAALATLDTRHFAATGHEIPHIAGFIGLSGPYDFLPFLDADVQDMFDPPQNYPSRSRSISCVPMRRPCCSFTD